MLAYASKCDNATSIDERDTGVHRHMYYKRNTNTTHHTHTRT